MVESLQAGLSLLTTVELQLLDTSQQFDQLATLVQLMLQQEHAHSVVL
jgi:hypothetical protein